MKRVQKVSRYERKTGSKLTEPMQALYEAMYDSKLSYSELEARSGVSDSAISRWFCEGQVTNMELYNCVANALGYKIVLVKEGGE